MKVIKVMDISTITTEMNNVVDDGDTDSQVRSYSVSLKTATNNNNSTHQKKAKIPNTDYYASSFDYSPFASYICSDSSSDDEDINPKILSSSLSWREGSGQEELDSIEKGTGNDSSGEFEVLLPRYLNRDSPSKRNSIDVSTTSFNATTGARPWHDTETMYTPNAPCRPSINSQSGRYNSTKDDRGNDRKEEEEAETETTIIQQDEKNDDGKDRIGFNENTRSSASPRKKKRRGDRLTSFAARYSTNRNNNNIVLGNYTSRRDDKKQQDHSVSTGRHCFTSSSSSYAMNTVGRASAKCIIQAVGSLVSPDRHTRPSCNRNSNDDDELSLSNRSRSSPSTTNKQKTRSPSSGSGRQRRRRSSSSKQQQRQISDPSLTETTSTSRRKKSTSNSENGGPKRRNRSWCGWQPKTGTLLSPCNQEPGERGGVRGKTRRRPKKQNHLSRKTETKTSSTYDNTTIKHGDHFQNSPRSYYYIDNISDGEDDEGSNGRSSFLVPIAKESEVEEYAIMSPRSRPSRCYSNEISSISSFSWGGKDDNTDQSSEEESIGLPITKSNDVIESRMSSSERRWSSGENTLTPRNQKDIEQLWSSERWPSPSKGWSSSQRWSSERWSPSKGWCSSGSSSNRWSTSTISPSNNYLNSPNEKLVQPRRLSSPVPTGNTKWDERKHCDDKDKTMFEAGKQRRSMLELRIQKLPFGSPIRGGDDNNIKKNVQFLGQCILDVQDQVWGWDEPEEAVLYKKDDGCNPQIYVD